MVCTKIVKLTKTNERTHSFQKRISLVNNIKFRKVRNHFQDQLQQELRRMKASNETMTFADKMTNISLNKRRI